MSELSILIPNALNVCDNFYSCHFFGIIILIGKVNGLPYMSLIVFTFYLCEFINSSSNQKKTLVLAFTINLTLRHTFKAVIEN